MPLALETFRTLELPNAAGGSSRLDSFWHETEVVFAFLRHYG